jgi:DNA-binding CsgD family transcriptional regulator
VYGRKNPPSLFFFEKIFFVISVCAGEADEKNVYRIRAVFLNDLSQIINQRAVPGTVILDLNNRIQFINKEALALLPPKIPEAVQGKGGFNPELPEEIYHLCDQIKGGVALGGGPEPPVRNGVILAGDQGRLYSARAFLIGRRGAEDQGSHVMVLLEKVAEKHVLNYAGVAGRYNLSKREVEVVRLICAGCTNRDIGGRLFISEHTVKDHIKNIMRKMEVATRNEIVAVLI